MRVVQMSPFSSPVKKSPSASFSPPTPPPLPKPILDIRNFKKDDWILLGIIATLILEGSTDYVLLCALGYLFLIGL